MKITLTGCIRSKKNHRQIFGAGKRKINIPPKAYLEWENNARKELMALKFNRPITSPVSVKATFYYKGSRMDLSACFEALADCIQGFLIENDAQIESWDGSRIIHDLKYPRTEFEILPYREEIKTGNDYSNLPF